MNIENFCNKKRTALCTKTLLRKYYTWKKHNYWVLKIRLFLILNRLKNQHCTSGNSFTISNQIKEAIKHTEHRSKTGCIYGIV